MHSRTSAPSTSRTPRTSLGRGQTRGLLEPPLERLRSSRRTCGRGRTAQSSRRMERPQGGVTTLRCERRGFRSTRRIPQNSRSERGFTPETSELHPPGTQAYTCRRRTPTILRAAGGLQMVVLSLRRPALPRLTTAGNRPPTTT